MELHVFHIYMEFRKMVMITLYAKQKETQMYRTDFWTLGEGEGGMFRENSMYIIYSGQLFYLGIFL